MSVHHAGAWCPQRAEEDLGSLELELQMVVSYGVGAGSETCDLWRSSLCYLPLSHLTSPHIRICNKYGKDTN